jgi:hypothetical protein
MELQRVRRTAMCSAMRMLIALLFLTIPAFALTDAELASIGNRVWKNECGGSRDGLTSWNAGEDFASLGIGHFIWYPKGPHGPFEESFPKLVKFLVANGAKVPEVVARRGLSVEFARGISGGISERTNEGIARAAFRNHSPAKPLPRAAHGGEPAQNARRSACRTARQCARAIPTHAVDQRRHVRVDRLRELQRRRDESRRALQRRRLGLLQVLAGMQGTGAGAPKEFSASAAATLTRRVQNSPPARNEQRWLPGWKNRVRAYGE